MGLETRLGDTVITTTLEKLVNWSRKSSPWALTFGLACCAIEMLHTGMSRHDIARFGGEAFRASPRQSDIMIISGRVSQKMAPVVKRLYEQMLEPKWVIAMGACGISGGIFRSSYNVVPGYNRIIPVDVYVPGCPPRPEALIYGIQMLQRKIARQPVLPDPSEFKMPQLPKLDRFKLPQLPKLKK